MLAITKDSNGVYYKRIPRVSIIKGFQRFFYIRIPMVAIIKGRYLSQILSKSLAKHSTTFFIRVSGIVEQHK